MLRLLLDEHMSPDVGEGLRRTNKTSLSPGSLNGKADVAWDGPMISSFAKRWRKD